jgi:hypothetical protein
MLAWVSRQVAIAFFSLDVRRLDANVIGDTGIVVLSEVLTRNTIVQVLE